MSLLSTTLFRAIARGPTDEHVRHLHGCLDDISSLVLGFKDIKGALQNASDTASVSRAGNCDTESAEDPSFVDTNRYLSSKTMLTLVQYLKSKDHNVVPPNNSRCSCWIKMLIISKMTALKFWSDISKENLF